MFGNKKIYIEELCNTYFIKQLKKLFSELSIIDETIIIHYIYIEETQIGHSKKVEINIYFRDEMIPIINGGLSYIEMINNTKLQGKSYEERRVIYKQTQNEIDKTFFDFLFNNKPYKSEKLALKSPFCCYASSGGQFPLDDDYWKIDEDGVWFRTIMLFENNIKYVSHAIRKTASEVFDNAKIKANGDNITIYPPFS